VSCEDGEDLRALPRTIDPLKTLICVNLLTPNSSGIRVLFNERHRNGDGWMDLLEQQ
jgi:hypothetical protein